MHRRLLLCVLPVFLALPSSMRADIPLPDAIFWGELCAEGGIAADGELVGVVQRAGGGEARVDAELYDLSGSGIGDGLHYALRIPLKSALGPGTLEDALLPGGHLVRVEFTVDGEDGSRVLWDGSGTDPEPRELVIGRLREIAFACSDVDFLRGDSNGDGRSDVSDPVHTLLYLFAGGTASCQKALDANDDGRVDISDPSYSLGWRFRGGPRPPAPFPGCGTDPSPDALSCESFPICPGGEDEGEGGGAGVDDGEVAAAPVVTSSALAASSGAGIAAPGRGVAQGAGVLRGGPVTGESQEDVAAALEVSPSTLLVGALPGAGVERTLVVRNGSHEERQVDIGVSGAVRTTALAAWPASFRLPANGAYAVRVRVSEGLDDSAALEVRTPGAPLLRVPVTASPAADGERLELASVETPAGREALLAVPLRLWGAGRSLPELRVSWDAARLEAAGFLEGAGSGVTASASEGKGELTLRLEGEPVVSGGQALLGHVLLRARGPLDAAAVPLRLEDVSQSLELTHGEVVARRAWLDLDGDGEVLASHEAVLARRHLAGLSPLYPSSWLVKPGELPAVAVAERVEARLGTLDADGSGLVDDADFRLIGAGLSGLEIEDAAASARVANLAAVQVDGADGGGRVRASLARLQSVAPARAGERVEVSLSLDLLEPLGKLELELRVDEERLVWRGFEPGVRLRAPLRVEELGAGRLRLRLERAEDGAPALAAGLEPLGRLLLEVRPGATPGWTRLELRDARTGRRLALRLAVRGERRDSVYVELCSPEAGAWRARIGLSQDAAQANLLRLRLRFPQVARVVEARGSGDAEVLVGRVAAGEATVVVQSATGESLPPGVALAALGFRDGGAAARVTVEEVRAYDAAGEESLAGATARARVRSLERCEPWEEGCGKADLARTLDLLEHLFAGGERPPCLEWLDLDADGVVGVRDALLDLERAGLK